MIHALFGLATVGVTMVSGDLRIEPYSVQGPNGDGLMEDSVVLSYYSKRWTGIPMESPPIQTRVGNSLRMIYSSSHSTLWTLSEELDSYSPGWKVVAPNMASGMEWRKKAGHEVGWSTGDSILYPPVLRKVELKRYPEMAGVLDMELWKEMDASGEESEGWGWLSDHGKADARASYEIVANLSIREFDPGTEYPDLLVVDDHLIDEGWENPEPWKRIYDGIQDVYWLDDRRILTINHTEHANAIATRPNYTFMDNVYLEPPQFFSLKGTTSKIPEAGYYDIAVCETEVYHNLFRPDYKIEFDPDSMTFDPMTYGYANPIFFFYKDHATDGDYNRYAWHQGLDWSNYYSFVTVNVIHLDDEGRYLGTIDYGPVVWPTNPYLNTNGSRRTRGVRSPCIVIRSEGDDEYIYLFYSELIGQEYEEAIEMGIPHPPETYPEIKLARAKLNREAGSRPFSTFKGYVGDYHNGTPLFLSRVEPLLDGVLLREFLENEPWDLEEFRKYMKGRAWMNRSLRDFTGRKLARKWEWELDTMTYHWEAVYAEKSDYGGVKIAKVKDTDYYLSVQQISYGGRPDGNITYETPRKYWRWVGSRQKKFEKILNGPYRLYLRVSKDLVHWSDPVIMNPGQIGHVWTSTGNETFTFYQSLTNGFDCYANNPAYQVAELPEFLTGKGCIQVSHDDRGYSGGDYLRFNAAGSLMVYVAFDNRYAEPDWLESWDLIDETVLITDGKEFHEMAIYEKAFDGESVILGGNSHDGLMYAVFFDMGSTSMNYPRFLSSDGASNSEVDINDFYIIGSKRLITDPEDNAVLEAEGNLPGLATVRLRMSLKIGDF